MDIHCFAKEEKNGASFAKVSEEEIEEAFFNPSDLVNTKTTIPLRVGEERRMYTSTLRVSVYIHQYSPTGPVAQLVEQRFALREVVSSTLAGPTLRVLK